MKIHKLLIILIIFASGAVMAGGIIIDAEIQNTIEKIAQPVLLASRLTNATIYVILDSKPNAFATNGEKIFLTSKLITLNKEPNIIRGVIAHEAGHITAGHVSSMSQKIEDSRVVTAASIILGATLMGLTSSPEAMMTSVVGGAHFAQRDILKFSRENEVAADLRAVSYLRNSGYNEKGLVSLLEYFNTERSFKNINTYEITHPISIERVRNIKAFNINEPSFIEDPLLLHQYHMSIAKLAAINSDEAALLNLSSSAKQYYKCINYIIKREHKKALLLINQLIRQTPSYPYFYQTKAEIEVAEGNINAINSYSKVLSLTNDNLVRIDKAIATIILSKNKNDIKAAISILELNLNKMENNNVIIKHLTLAYDKIDDKTYCLYYRALSEYLHGDRRVAKNIAKAAIASAKSDAHIKKNSSNKAIENKINDILIAD
ncbi:MAG: M48 family metalloprotease [Rickettsiaceae bacterium]|nr:M48 family metalloprotease [Rickettsiaceae bacterium]